MTGTRRGARKYGKSVIRRSLIDGEPLETCYATRSLRPLLRIHAPAALVHPVHRCAVLGILMYPYVHCGSRSEEHPSELQSLMRSSYAVLYLKKKKRTYIGTI